MNALTTTAPWKEAPRLPAAPGSAAGSYAAGVKRLEALAFDGDAENLRVLFGGPAGAARSYRLAAEDFFRFLSVHPAFPWAHALRGKALLNAGDLAGAREALDEALRLEPGLAHAYLWRAQASLAERRADGASADVDRFTAIAGGSPWAYFLRGLCRAFSGDSPGAEKAWKESLRWAPGSVPARALLGLSRAGSGRPEDAVRMLEDVARSAGRTGPTVLALKALVERQLGRLEDSRASLDRAIGAAPSPWMFSHRADVLNRMGFYEAALDDLGRLTELAPDDPAAWAQAANVLFDQAFYDDAFRAIDAALERAPEDPALLARRGRMQFVAARFDEAAETLARAKALRPGDLQTAYEHATALALAGRPSEAAASLKGREWTGSPLKPLVQGLLAARGGDYASARRLFLAAASAARKRKDPSLVERASFYALVCRLLAVPSSHRPIVPPGLTLCSMGARHPYQSTVETIRALAAAAVVFNNVPDPQVVEFLGLFQGALSAVPRVRGGEDQARAAWILDQAPAGKAAAFVTRLHPNIYRRIGFDLAQACRERGVPLKGSGAVSLTELASGLSAEAGARGRRDLLRIVNIDHLVTRPSWLQPRLPALVYCISSDAEQRRRLARLLLRRYPRTHTGYLLGGSGDREFRALPVRLGALEDAFDDADTGAVLYLPEVG